MGCTTAQGYYLSRPMPVAEVEGWLRDWSSRAGRLNAA
jgi:EAL domain-containing protein (putative c-di-GMP-specific phosphodiesterase class I)